MNTKYLLNQCTNPYNSSFKLKEWPRGRAFFTRQPVKLLSKYERWRKVAEILKLSKIARQRLEWFIYYEIKAKNNALLTCRHFGITPKTFYKWQKRFNPLNLRLLEDQGKAPKHTRQWQVTPLEEQRIIQLKKQYIRYGKEKIAVIYQQTFNEKITSWKAQRVIEKHSLYYHPVKTARIKRKRQKALKKKRITELQKKQLPGFIICFDAIEIIWNGLRRYIFTAIDRCSKVAFARMYTTKSSYNARDFLQRVYYLLNGRIFNAGHDNGSEFQKYFAQTCKELNIPQYHSRPYTPKDNPVNEKFNQTLKQEFIDLGNFTTDVSIFNRNLTEWLIEYNFHRPHQSLNYSTPIKFTEKTLKLLPMWSSSA